MDIDNKKNNFFLNYLDFNYYNSNYQIKSKNTVTKEVLITNFNIHFEK